MRIVGFRQHGGDVQVGALSEDGARVTALATLEEFWSDAATLLAADPAAAMGAPDLAVADVELVPPVLPGARVVCIGLNYLKHVAEGSFADQALPEHPTLFARWTQSLSVGGVGVPVPVDEDGLDWEGEVVAYVGAELADATPEEALAAVVGYSTFNDITARRAQKLTSQWILGKNADRSVRWADRAGRRGRRPARRAAGAHPGQRRDRAGRLDRRDGLHGRGHPGADQPHLHAAPG